MWMWIFIFSMLILGLALGIVYLVSRFYKMPYVKRWSAEKRGKKVILAVFPVAIISGAMYLILDSMNTIICILHLVVIWFVCDGVNMLIQKKRGKKSNYYVIGLFAVVVTFVYLCAGWYLANHVWRTAYNIQTEKAVGDLRIVQFADSHVGTTFDGLEFADHVRSMQAEKPDVVLITGDFVDDDTSKEDMINACKALGTLKTKYGVYYAFGNHDKGYYDNEYRGYSGTDLIAELEKNGVKVLQDETVLLDNRFYLIGRQDRSEEQRGESRAEMKDLVKDLDTGKFSIVLDHQPHDYDAQEKSKVDLVLSGHTHGGQLLPINYVGEWTGENDKTYGWEKQGDTNFIVTSGISDWAIKFKTGCKSEYVVIDVKGKTETTTG